MGERSRNGERIKRERKQHIKRRRKERYGRRKEEKCSVFPQINPMYLVI